MARVFGPEGKISLRKRGEYRIEISDNTILDEFVLKVFDDDGILKLQITIDEREAKRIKKEIDER